MRAQIKTQEEFESIPEIDNCSWHKISPKSFGSNSSILRKRSQSLDLTLDIDHTIEQIEKYEWTDESENRKMEIFEIGDLESEEFSSDSEESLEQHSVLSVSYTKD